MPRPASPQTVGRNTVMAGQDTFCIAGNKGGNAVIEPQEAVSISDALASWVGAGKPKNVALLVGGPAHMEFHAVPDRSPVVVFTPRTPLQFYTSAAQPVGVQVFEHEQYTRVKFDAATERSFPFAIYEHDSVRKANVKRRVEQLDEQIAASSAEVQIKKDQVRYANDSKTARSKALDNAKQRYNAACDQHREAQSNATKADEALTVLLDERHQIAHDHGI